MNKMMKGSIAGATGVALLMGGFGTYALWSDSEPVGASAVTSGNMHVASAGAATFQDQNLADWGAGDLIVPGDTITRLQSFDFTGAGNNLAGRIRFVPGAQTNEFENLTITVTATGVDDIDGTGGCFDFTIADLPESIDTTVEYAFDSSTPNQEDFDADAAVAEGTFYIEQGQSCPAA